MPVTMSMVGTPRGGGGGDKIKEAWAQFMDAAEVVPAMTAYGKLRKACGVDPSAGGRVAFDIINRQTQGSSTIHRTKELVKKIGQTWDRQNTDNGRCIGVKVVISGAGPVGLRAACAAAMMGMQVHVLEKREVFSRVKCVRLASKLAPKQIARMTTYCSQALLSPPLLMSRRLFDYSCSFPWLAQHPNPVEADRRRPHELWRSRLLPQVLQHERPAASGHTRDTNGTPQECSALWRTIPLRLGARRAASASSSRLCPRCLRCLRLCCLLLRLLGP